MVEPGGVAEDDQSKNGIERANKFIERCLPSRRATQGSRLRSGYQPTLTPTYTLPLIAHPTIFLKENNNGQETRSSRFQHVRNDP